MAPQLEVSHHGHGASSSLPTGAPHSPTSCQRPRLRAPELGSASHTLTEEDGVDVGRVGPLESDGSTQPASKRYIPLQGQTQLIQPTNQTRVDVG